MQRFVLGIVAACVLIGGTWMYLGAPEASDGVAAEEDGPERLEVPGSERVVLDPTAWDDPKMLASCSRIVERIEEMWGPEDLDRLGEAIRAGENGRGGIDPMKLKSLCEETATADDATIAKRARALMAGDFNLETVN